MKTLTACSNARNAPEVTCRRGGSGGGGAWLTISGSFTLPFDLELIAVVLTVRRFFDDSLDFDAALTGLAFDAVLTGLAFDAVLTGLALDAVLMGLAFDPALMGLAFDPALIGAFTFLTAAFGASDLALTCLFATTFF
ncbi:MAG: hypothetical protein ACREAB_10340 [Blastocatellia bacterium]